MLTVNPCWLLVAAESCLACYHHALATSDEVPPLTRGKSPPKVAFVLGIDIKVGRENTSKPRFWITVSSNTLDSIRNTLQGSCTTLLRLPLPVQGDYYVNLHFRVYLSLFVLHSRVLPHSSATCQEINLYPHTYTHGTCKVIHLLTCLGGQISETWWQMHGQPSHISLNERMWYDRGHSISIATILAKSHNIEARHNVPMFESHFRHELVVVKYWLIT